MVSFCCVRAVPALMGPEMQPEPWHSFWGNVIASLQDLTRPHGLAVYLLASIFKDRKGLCQPLFEARP